MKKSSLLGAVCACLLSITVTPAFASFVYNYTGNPYTSVQSPYDTSMAVTGTLELAAALTPNLTLTTVTPLSFSFSDGINTTTDATATLTSSQFEFATDSTGNITAWVVQMFTFDADAPVGQLRQSSLLTENNGSSVNDSVLTEICTAFSSTCIASNTAQAQVLDQPGSWTTVVPIPGAMWLFGSGLLGLVGIARRKK